MTSRRHEKPRYTVSRHAVLSSILIDIYVNDIRPTCKLSASGRGCHVAGIGIGVLGLMCADDRLLLISSTGTYMH